MTNKDDFEQKTRLYYVIWYNIFNNFYFKNIANSSNYFNNK